MIDHSKFDFKRVACPVHGTIGLSELETRILNTAAFRRLRNVKQLGLAYYVYPGADYSRFSHSLGVCHVTGRILDAIAKHAPDLDTKEYQIYRLAALLHDIGHYPFSHAMEEAIADYFGGQMIEPRADRQEQAETGTASSASPIPKFYKHEEVGEQVLKHDAEIGSILDESEIAAAEIYSIFNRQNPPRFANLVSSDLDADRVDYLLRTAHHTGLPYGSVDLSYILSQVRLDRDMKICITPRAIRTADHFLLCRHFDYQQVSYHKTVAALEFLLKDVLQDMIRNGRIPASAADVVALIKSSKWSECDDLRVFEMIRRFARSTKDEIARQKAEALIERTPPKLVANVEFFGDEHLAARYDDRRQLWKRCVQDVAKEFGIDIRLWHVWARRSSLTKVGPHFPVSAAEGLSDKDQDRVAQAIRVVNLHDGNSRPIMEVESSLMSTLAELSLFTLRVYVLLKPEQLALREEIENRFATETGASP